MYTKQNSENSSKHSRRCLTWLLATLATTLVYTAVAHAASFQIVTPSGDSAPDVEVAIHSINGDGSLKSAAVGRTDSSGRYETRLKPGNYLVVLKGSAIKGDLRQLFSADFVALVSYVRLNSESEIVKLEALRMTVNDARLIPTDTFSAYYEKAEAGKKARLDLVPGHTGRVLRMAGSPIASAQVEFPKNSVGTRGMRTYTPHAFDIIDDNTLVVRTYMYNGLQKNDHDVVTLGNSIISDHRNRLVLENIQDKSGVEVPFEPKARVLRDGCVTDFIANISFLSDEKHAPATVVFKYFYLDDPATPTNIDALISPSCWKS